MSAAMTSSAPARNAFADKQLHVVDGYLMLAIGLVSVAFLCCLSYFWFDPQEASLIPVWRSLAPVVIAAPLVIIGVVTGFVVLQPNESLVCLLFGSYVGTEHRPGFWWVNPFNSKNKVSRRLETLESGPLKVNDAVGNPIDIGAVIVWRVEDAAKALLEVASYSSYVKSQSETALRRMVSVHPYDLVETDEAERQGEPVPTTAVSLRDGGDAVIEALLQQLRARMEPIGVTVLEARISHLAYSSEIASAMLRKQAASAVVAARRMIVKGAVSIVEDALNELDKKKLADALDPERKAAMISNLLVVLVGDREVSPVINTGTLYS